MQTNGPSRDELIAEVHRLSEELPTFFMPRHKVITMPKPAGPDSEQK